MLETKIRNLLSTWGAMSTWDVVESLNRAGQTVSAAAVQSALQACAEQSGDRTNGQRLWTLRAAEGCRLPNQQQPTGPTGGDGIVTPCPQCGGSMRLRVASRGKTAGQAFLGCAHFPRCRGSLPALESMPAQNSPQAPITPQAPEQSRAREVPASLFESFRPTTAPRAGAVPAARTPAAPRFVRDAELGIGRYDAATRQVRYFESPAVSEIVVPADARRLRGITLSAQERVWWFDGLRWTVGRIGPMHDAGESYTVFFPNGKTGRVAADELRVRWARPMADPLGLLVTGTVETRFFHTHRSRFLRTVAAQRSACLGLRGLASAGVQIHDHQIGAARRVLSDPVPRYLLADEVGMGKTIEAGLVLRQLLIDEAGVCTVVVPDRLVGQWRQELQSKFRIDDLGGVVEVIGHSLVEDLDQDDRSLVIVDEAHRFCDGVQYGSGDAADRRYQSVRRIAHRSNALLLLSATPVRSNEDGFLGLLHLLDPQNYPLEDVAGFRHRVAIRDDLAEAMSALGADTPVRYLAEPLGRIAGLLADDAIVAAETAQALAHIEARSFDQARDNVANLRVHVSEAYRLHRRMIRNRRTSAAQQDFPVRGRCKADHWSLVDPDPRRPEMFRVVEAFRSNLGAYEVSNAGALLRVVLGRALGPVEALRDVVTALRGGQDHDLDRRELAAATALAGTAWGDALCADLEALLNMRAVDTRISAAVAWARKRVGKGKFAIACSHPRTARLVFEALRTELGSHRVSALLEDQSEEYCAERVAEFEARPEQNILVLDRSAEEGTNLQFVETILHLNLPTNTSSLEQRIGRIDRWSRLPYPAASVVFTESDALREEHLGAWLELLDRVFGVFSSSTSTLQYAIADVEDAFFSGAVADNFATARARMDAQAAELELMQRRIVGQDSLDSIEDRSEDQALAANLRHLDQESWTLRGGLRDYLVDVLKFACVVEDETIRFNVKKSEPPLVTERVVKEVGGRRLDRRYTCLRSEASAKIGLIRSGEPLVDAFATYARIDDRGRAFASEFARPGADPNQDPWIAFCFDFAVSPTLPEDVLDCDSAFSRAVRARAEMYLPETNEQIWWMLGKGECPSDLVRHLEGNWSRGDNLGSRPDRFRELTRNLDWSAQCREAMDRALARVQKREALVRSFADGRTRAFEAARRERAVLSARADTDEHLELSGRIHETVAAALAAPQFVLESCGVVFLTGRTTR